MALVVPTDDAGLQLFPTHRVFVNRADVASGADDEPASSLEDALARLEDATYDRSAVVRYRRGDVGLLRGAPGELDVELVDRYGLDGIRYTPRLDEASEPSTAAPPMPRSSSAGPASTTSSRPLGAASACLRRARTSIPSPCPASSSIR